MLRGGGGYHSKLLPIVKLLCIVKSIPVPFLVRKGPLGTQEKSREKTILTRTFLAKNCDQGNPNNQGKEGQGVAFLRDASEGQLQPQHPRHLHRRPLPQLPLHPAQVCHPQAQQLRLVPLL